MRQFMNNSFLNTQWRAHYFIQFTKFLSKISRNYLRSIKLRSSDDFDLMILSASIDDGLWSTPKYVVLSNLQANENQY